ncbi:MAG: BlaI/MecI/CopY family transcriptional regulator, partial [Clostridia bacterium]|nr:BlaI/MecI/CopY family transcriptional regulator [Clostridia bacterium]
ASMQGKSKAFEPLVNEKDYIAVESRSFISKLRGRSTITDLVTTLYDTNEISNKDIEELDAFIEKIKKEGK